MQPFLMSRNIGRLAALGAQRSYCRRCMSAASMNTQNKPCSSALQWPLKQQLHRSSCSFSTCQRLTQQRVHDPAAAPAAADRASQASSNKVCWRCHRESDPSSVFCENEQCSAIQPVGKNTTYYDVLLSTNPTFDVDVSDLRRRFLKLQQGVHPDSYSQREDIERKLAETQSSWINHAYATLRDPLLRARYLLKLRGNGISEEDQITDPELLMEVMETREDIEMARTEGQIANIKKKNDTNIESVVSGLSQAFTTGDLDHAKQLTNHFQYLRRVSQAINVWEPGKPVVIAH
ncbi:Co-chaperone Hsc20 [Martensiomyces pterosporus]|nr:Co-chaperone Hsc20 [Martensiomyces pterosporus]